MIVDPTKKGSSTDCVCSEIVRGAIKLETERISTTLKMFDPRMFPMRSSVFSFRTADIPRAISGILVPTATSDPARADLAMPKVSAIVMIESMSKSAENASPANPRRIKRGYFQ